MNDSKKTLRWNPNPILQNKQAHNFIKVSLINNHLFRLFIPYFIWLTGVRIAIWNQLVEIWPFQNLYFYPKNSIFFHIQSMIFNFAYAQITTPRSSIDSRISTKYIEKESSFTLYRRSPFSAHFLRRGRIHSIWPRTPQGFWTLYLEFGVFNRLVLLTWV